MNVTSAADNDWIRDIQYGNKGAALFMITYIGLYGVSILFLFGFQLKLKQRHQYDLPAYFLKSLWDVPRKNKLYRSYK